MAAVVAALCVNGPDAVLYDPQQPSKTPPALPSPNDPPVGDAPVLNATDGNDPPVEDAPVLKAVDSTSGDPHPMLPKYGLDKKKWASEAAQHALQHDMNRVFLKAPRSPAPPPYPYFRPPCDVMGGPRGFRGLPEQLLGETAVMHQAWLHCHPRRESSNNLISSTYYYMFLLTCDDAPRRGVAGSTPPQTLHAGVKRRGLL